MELMQLLAVTPRSTMVHNLWPYLHWQLAAGYFWWAVTWACVATYYLRSGKRQWQVVAPEYKGGPVRVWFYGVLMMCLGSLVRLVEGKFRQPFKDSELTHPLSMTLQQGIVCSALCSVAWGLSLFHLERGNFMTGPQFTVTVFCLVLSSVGAMIHLYPPMRQNHIVLWRCMMLTTWLGFSLSYLAGVALYLLS
jgi:hypothetical protein